MFVLTCKLLNWENNTNINYIENEPILFIDKTPV